MDKFTKTALDFIDSGSVREFLIKNGTVFSAEDTIPIVFNSSKPQYERFSTILEILSEMDTPEANRLAEILKNLNEITCTAHNPHYIFREKYRSNPRRFLTAAQMMKWLKKGSERYLIVDVLCRGKVIYSELYLDKNGIYDICCPGEVKRLLTDFKPPQLTFFEAGNIVRDITDGSLWVVIDADFTSDRLNNLSGWEIIDFSAMVVPYKYREYATPELIRRHYSEREPGTVDLISIEHQHLYIPILELVTPAEMR